MSSAESTNKLTYDHYVCFPDDGCRHEIMDGDHFMNPAPTTYHQAVLQRLLVQLYMEIEQAGLGRVFPAPTDVQLSDYDIVQPDIVVIAKAREQMITPIKVKGSPDLLVEVISPSSKQNDEQLKRQMYERHGVGEYWIVDPEEHALLQLVLAKNKYTDRSHDDNVTSAMFPSVVVSLKEVW